MDLSLNRQNLIFSMKIKSRMQYNPATSKRAWEQKCLIEESSKITKLFGPILKSGQSKFPTVIAQCQPTFNMHDLKHYQKLQNKQLLVTQCIQ